MLSDEFIQAHALRLNANFKKVAAPFAVNCGRPDKGNKVRETFYRIGKSCIDVPKMYWVSESDVAKYLDRNKLPSLSVLRKDENITTKLPKADKQEPARVSKTSKSPQKSPKAKAESPKVNKIGKIIIGKDIEIETSSETLKGTYALMPLDMLIPSHNFATFSKNKDYPAGCQEREYHSNKQLQANVANRSKNLKPLHLLNEDLTAESGPPIVNRNGVVLGGNSRAMILQNVHENFSEKWREYQRELNNRLSNYGIGSSAGVGAPVLVRLVDVDMTKCSHYSWILNTSTKNEEDISGRAIAYAKDIDEKALAELGEYLAETEVESLAQIFENSTTRQKIIKTLRNAGVINDTNVSKWLKDNTFTAEAKLIIESMLVGVVLQNKQLIESAKLYTNKIIAGIPFMLRIKAIKGEWNITKNIENAIKYESNRRSKSMTKPQFVSTDDVFGNNPTRKDILVWDLMDLKPTDFKKAVKKYADVAEKQTSDTDEVFGKPNLNPEKVLEDILNKKIRLDDGKANVSLKSGKRSSTLNDKPKRELSIFRKIGNAIANDPLVKFVKKIG